MSQGEQPAERPNVFDLVAATYENVGVPWFAPIARRLVAELDPQPGERALDAGCGRGAALFPLAEGVGRSGRVRGVDLSGQMVAATRADVAARGWEHVEVSVGDVGAPGLPQGPFDIVAASLVLFFLPRPQAALAAWRQVLAPGGRLGITTFADRDPRWERVDAVFGPYLPPQMLDARTSGASGPFASDAGVEELVRSAGYDEVRTVGFDVLAEFSDEAQWHEWSWSHGQRAMWAAVPESARPSVRADAYRELAACRDEDGRIRLRQGVRLTLARRPGQASMTTGTTSGLR